MTKISKDELARWDPAVTSILTVNGQVKIDLAYNTSVLYFTKGELNTLLKLIEESKNVA